MTFNDKHQQEQEGQEFSRTSNQWIIHPKYDQAAGNNYDLCLVKLERPIDLIKGSSLKRRLFHVGDGLSLIYTTFGHLHKLCYIRLSPTLLKQLSLTT